MSEGEQEQLVRNDVEEIDEKPSNNDFVIREGFPALRLPGGKAPWIDGDEPIPRHAFWAQAGAMEFPEDQLESLRRDCEDVFSAREREQDQPYSAGVTYFCPSQMKPRCALEALALNIFHKHTQHLDAGVMVPEQSGAEWWTLVLHLDEEKKSEANGRSDSDDEEEEDEGDEVGLHFDADYGLEDQAPNLLIHPRLGTVTYLTDVGSPTLVLDKRSPRPDDSQKKSLNGPIRRGWLSHPAVGKHMSFDGRLLHGAPTTFFPPRERKPVAIEPPPEKKQKIELKRITLLVNLWINHCPLDAELLDDEICESLQTPFKAEGGMTDQPFFSWNQADFDAAPTCDKVSLVPSKSEPAGEEEFVLCGHGVTAKYGAAMEDLHSAVNRADVVELEMASGVLSLEVGPPVVDASDDSDHASNE